jgi:hypothetical protein
MARTSIQRALDQLGGDAVQLEGRVQHVEAVRKARACLRVEEGLLLDSLQQHTPFCFLVQVESC